MTLRTGKGGRYRYYTCSTKARQGETGCMGRTVPMQKLDTLVADHIERRLLQPARLEEILSSVLDRREERAERRTAHIAALRKRAAETDAKLKRLYDAIENGIADLADPMLKDRIAELKATRDQARADAERAEGALDRLGPAITKPSPGRPAGACAQRAAATAATIFAHSLSALKWTRGKFASWGPKAYCFAPSSVSSARTAGFGVPSSVPKWRARQDSKTCDLCLRRATVCGGCQVRPRFLLRDGRQGGASSREFDRQCPSGHIADTTIHRFRDL